MVSSATLIILGESLDPSVATKLLGMRPSQQWRRGDQMSYKLKDGTIRLFDSVHEWGGWKKWSTDAKGEKEFETLLMHWCRKRAPKKKALARLRASGNETFLDCCLAGDSAAFQISPRLLAKLASLDVILRVSFYHANESPEPMPLKRS